MVWLIPCILLTLGLVGALALFLSVKRELRVNARRTQKRMEQLMAQLEQKAATPAAPAETVYVPVTPPSGMNQTRRVQALRLLRRGEGIEHVCAALGMPRCEVELLIRVQDLMRQRTMESSGVSDPATEADPRIAS